MTRHTLTPKLVRKHFEFVRRTKSQKVLALLNQVYDRFATIFAVRNLQPDQVLDQLTVRLLEHICTRIYSTVLRSASGAEIGGEVGFVVMMLDAHKGDALACKLLDVYRNVENDFVCMVQELEAARKIGFTYPLLQE
jgi:hypothetical protein